MGLCLSFLQQAAGSSLRLTLVFGKTKRNFLDGKRHWNITVSELSYGNQASKIAFMEVLLF